MFVEYIIPPKRTLKILCKSKHFPRRCKRKREWVFFLNTVYIEDRPLIWPILGKFQMAISPRWVVRSLHVWFCDKVFVVGGSNGAISGFTKSKMAARPPSWKIQMAISPRRIVRFTSCLVLGWGFRGRRIEWR